MPVRVFRFLMDHDFIHKRMQQRGRQLRRVNVLSDDLCEPLNVPRLFLGVVYNGTQLLNGRL